MIISKTVNKKKSFLHSTVDAKLQFILYTWSVELPYLMNGHFKSDTGLLTFTLNNQRGLRFWFKK